MLESFVATLRDALDRIAPGPETLERRDTEALEKACCALLAEVARIDASAAAAKREALARAMRETLGVPDERSAPLIAEATKKENRLTSYYDEVTIINRRLTPGERVAFIEQLWRVAHADGHLDIYEDALVRELAELLYVAHSDFILAKHRVLNGQ